MNLIRAIQREAESELTIAQIKSYFRIAAKYSYDQASEALSHFLVTQKPGSEFPLARELERRIKKYAENTHGLRA